MLDRAFGHPLKLEEGATTPLAGGIMQHGYQCGMIWGAALAAGAEAYRRLGPGPQAEDAAVRAAQKVVEAFRTRHDEINCLEITDIDKDSSTWEMINFFLIKGGTLECFRMSSWFAPLAFEAIDSELGAVEGHPAGARATEADAAEVHAGEAGAAEPQTAEAGAGKPHATAADAGEGDAAHANAKAAAAEEPKRSPPPPVSCAAVLAKKLGVSEQQAVMAAGLAGGIGLCGGACGALGAAIWILGMKIAAKDGKKIGYKDSRTQEVIDRFLKETEFRFECSEIVGRTFDDVEDHAAYLQGGGCSQLIEALAGA